MKTVEGDRTIHRKADKKERSRDLLGWARKESRIASKGTHTSTETLAPKNMHFYSKAVASALH